MRGIVAAGCLLFFFASTAHAVPSIRILWHENQSPTVAVSPSATVHADIVLQGEAPLVIAGVFVTIEFDESELQAIGGSELGMVNLPGMGNAFKPIEGGVDIDNVAGQVTLFDQATLATGFATSGSRTLGSVTFHVLNPTGGTGEADVIVSLANTGIDAIVIDGVTIEAGPGRAAHIAFEGADVILAAVPEPATGLLLLGGAAALVCAGRRRG